MADVPVTCSDAGHAARQGQPGWAAVLGTADRPRDGHLCGACGKAAADLAAQQAGNADSCRSKAAAAVAQLEQADANWPTLTAAQKDAANRLAVRAAAKLARLAAGMLDAS